MVDSARARDSLYGEQIVWTGGPKVVSVPTSFKIVAVVATVVSVVSVAFAVVVGAGLGQPVGSLVMFAGWCATIALGAWRLPLWFRAPAEYIVTDNHVIWRRGRLRRSIERSAISYAIIRWSSVGKIGDLVLERAVPTGALRRTLSLTLPDVESPDRLWAIVRGLTPGAPLGDGSRPLAQRLDDGERVLWTAFPRASRWTTRRFATAAGGVAIAATALHLVLRAAPSVARVLRAHALPPAVAAFFAGGLALAVLLLLSVAVWVAYAAIWRPVRLARATRYFVTDRRVLIRRGAEELHLDRERIAYVITLPTTRLTALSRDNDARRDLFLVLDGKDARAFSPSGAFGGSGSDSERLVPMFAAIEDADTATELLHVSRISITEAPVPLEAA